MPSRTRSQNKFSRTFMTNLDAINSTSLKRCCYDPLKPSDVSKHVERRLRLLT